MTMKHSGVAITITSVTDLLAFGIGATSILPALGTFCAYAALGIFAVFIYMASFFLAWLVIDQRRIDARRDGFICCWKKHESWTPNKCSQLSIMDWGFRKYADVLIKIPVKIAILLVTAALLGVSIYGVTQLETNFDFVDWFPQDSYLTNYFLESKKHFPSGGIQGKVYVSEIPKIEEKLEALETLLANVSNVPDLRDNDMKSFLPPFFKFLNDKGINNKTFSDQDFRAHLRSFLCSSGLIYSTDIYYVGGEKLSCNYSAMSKTPHVQMLTFGYQHKR